MPALSPAIQHTLALLSSNCVYARKTQPGPVIPELESNNSLPWMTYWLALPVLWLHFIQLCLIH